MNTDAKGLMDAYLKAKGKSGDIEIAPVKRGRMSDLISREAAIEAIDGLVSTMSVCVSTDECRGMNWMKKRAIKAIEEVPSEPGWIPVSERMPEEETDVLICNINGDIELSSGSYSTEVKDDFIWYTSGWRFGKVIAWMELPEPWRGEEDEAD